jgi:hypothetical protein
MATQTRHLSQTTRKFLGLAAAVAVTAIALWGLVLLRRNSHQSPAAKLGQPAQAVAADGVATVAGRALVLKDFHLSQARDQRRYFFDGDSLA